MIWSLMRQDPALRSLPFTAMLAVAIGIFLRAVIGDSYHSAGSLVDEVNFGWLRFAYAFLWLKLVLLGLIGDAPSRCSRRH